MPPPRAAARVVSERNDDGAAPRSLPAVPGKRKRLAVWSRAFLKPESVDVLTLSLLRCGGRRCENWVASSFVTSS